MPIVPYPKAWLAQSDRGVGIEYQAPVWEGKTDFQLFLVVSYF